MCSKIILKSLYLFAFWLSCQTVQAACTIAECEQEIFIRQAGFYLASADIGQYVYDGIYEERLQIPYFWSLSVLTSDGTNQGGFNSGLTLSNHLSFNGFIAFYLQHAEAISITPYRYTGDADHFTLSLQQQNVNTGERVTVFQDNNAATGVALQTDVLAAGFYVINVKANNADDSIQADQRAGITIDAKHMTGGVHVGGWYSDSAITPSARFAGFYIAKPQTVRFRLAFNEAVQAAGMSKPLIKLYHQTETGVLEPYSSIKDETLAVSTDALEQLANQQAITPAVSANGRYIAFASIADNLVANDDNGIYDIFVKDVQTGEIERVSVGSDGQVAYNYQITCTPEVPCKEPWNFEMSKTYGVCADSVRPAISGDGRYVGFISAAVFDADDNNNEPDLFVHDRTTGETKRIALTLTPHGQKLANDTESGTVAACNRGLYNTQAPPYALMNYQAASLSGDGQWIAFETNAALLPEDTNDAYDIYVYQWDTGNVQRVSVDSQGAQAESISMTCEAYWENFCSNSIFQNDVTITPDSHSPSISQDGRFIAFTSTATQLVSDDNNLVTDVFVHDRETGTTRRVSVSTEGQQTERYFIPCYGGSSCMYTLPYTHGGNIEPVISADGRYITFTSTATNLIADYNATNRQDVYIHDQLTGMTEAVSVDSNGQLSEQDNIVYDPYRPSFLGGNSATISADGRYVLFLSTDNRLDVNEPEIQDNHQPFVFLRDRQQGTTQRLKPFATLDNSPTLTVPVLSADAALMAFQWNVREEGMYVDKSQVYVMMLQ